jgi:hypothetical protein
MTGWIVALLWNEAEVAMRHAKADRRLIVPLVVVTAVILFIAFTALHITVPVDMYRWWRARRAA